VYYPQWFIVVVGVLIAFFHGTGSGRGLSALRCTRRSSPAALEHALLESHLNVVRGRIDPASCSMLSAR
jgi:hypothetical protein